MQSTNKTRRDTPDAGRAQPDAQMADVQAGYNQRAHVASYAREEKPLPKAPAADDARSGGQKLQ